MCSILFQSLANVKYWSPPDDWFQVGGTERSLEHAPIDFKDPKAFYYRFAYKPEFSRFIYAKEYKKDDLDSLEINANLEHICPVCQKTEAENVSEQVKLLDQLENEADSMLKLWKSFKFRRGVQYNIGDSIFIRKSGSDKQDKAKETIERKEMDPKTYPEYYRKFKGDGELGHSVKGSNKTTNPPFDIGIIEEILSDQSGNKVRISVRFLYRPEQTCLDSKKAFGKDLNLLYWSNSIKKINVDLVEGKCFIRSEQSLLEAGVSIESWSKGGEYRFYFNQFYDRDNKEITSDLPYEAENYGKKIKSSGKVSFQFFNPQHMKKITMKSRL